MIVWFFPIHLAAFVVAAVNSGRCLRCFSGRFGSDKPFKIARYAIYDDAIIAVGISTNGNDINNNYKMIKASTQRALDEKWSRLEVARKGLRTGNVTDGRCVLFKMSIRQLQRDACLIRSQFQH